MLDKVEPPTVPDGYGLSVGFYCLVEAVRTIQLLIEGEQAEGRIKDASKKMESGKVEAGGDTTVVKGNLCCFGFGGFRHAPTKYRSHSAKDTECKVDGIRATCNPIWRELLVPFSGLYNMGGSPSPA